MILSEEGLNFMFFNELFYLFNLHSFTSPNISPVKKGRYISHLFGDQLEHDGKPHRKHSKTIENIEHPKKFHRTSIENHGKPRRIPLKIHRKLPWFCHWMVVFTVASLAPAGLIASGSLKEILLLGRQRVFDRRRIQRVLIEGPKGQSDPCYVICFLCFWMVVYLWWAAIILVLFSVWGLFACPSWIFKGMSNTLLYFFCSSINWLRYTYQVAGTNMCS